MRPEYQLRSSNGSAEFKLQRQLNEVGIDSEFDS